MKLMTFNQTIFPVLTNCHRDPKSNKENHKKLKVTQRQMERSILGRTLKDRVRNKEIR